MEEEQKEENSGMDQEEEEEQQEGQGDPSTGEAASALCEDLACGHSGGEKGKLAQSRRCTVLTSPRGQGPEVPSPALRWASLSVPLERLSEAQEGPPRANLHAPSGVAKFLEEAEQKRKERPHQWKSCHPQKQTLSRKQKKTPGEG